MGPPFGFLNHFHRSAMIIFNNMKKMLFVGRKGFLIPEKYHSTAKRLEHAVSATFLNAKWLGFQ